MLPVINARLGEDRLAECDPPPRWTQINLLVLVGDSLPTECLLGHSRHELLDQLQHRVVVGIRLIRLEEGEFGVVPAR